MPFDGVNRNTCPNEQGNDDDWNTFRSARGESEVGFGTSNFNRECFNICETSDLDMDGNPTSSHYIENGVCKTCPNPGDDSLGEDSPPSGSVQDLMNKGIYGMCFNSPSGPDLIDGTPNWFSRQQAANLRSDFMNEIDWTSDESKQFWMNVDGPLSDNEILRMIGNKRPGTTEYSMPEDFNSMDELRQAINEGRGSTIECRMGAGGEDPTRTHPDWITEENPCILREGTLYFGPEHIIAEEVRDFIVERMNRRFEDSVASGRRSLDTFSDLLSSITGDSTFEACVNDKLNTGENDNEIQTRIASYNNLSEFLNEDINYLKRKLRKIVTIKTDEVSECMNLLNLGQSVCRTGVADKTLQIGHLIFSIVGNDRIDVLNMTNDEQIKLNKMIDELGPLIPQAIKNIIHVSKEYESRICNVPSNTTLLLERVYIDLYDKPTEVNFDFSPYIDFNSLINIDDNVKFIKTIFVLVVFAYLFMHFANIVVAFLSRGSSVTKVA